MARNRRPYYLHPRNGVFYVQIYNPLTGRLLPARSTGETNEARAHVIAAEWYRTGKVGVEKTKAVTLSGLSSFDALLHGLKTAELSPDQARRLIGVLDSRGLLLDRKATVNRRLVDFLAEFYDWEKSPFVREKLALGQRIGKTHCLDMGGRVRRSWEPYFKDKRMVDLTRADLKAFGRHLAAQGLAPGSINKTMMVGKTALGWACREGLLPVDPAKGLPQYKGAQAVRGVLAGDEWSRLLAVQWEDERAAVGALVAGTAGLRLGEVLALELEDIGEDRLAVRGSWSNVERVKKSPKSGESRVAVLLPHVRVALLALAAKNPHAKGRRWVFWSRTRSDVPCDQKTLVDGLYRALNTLGIDEAERTARNLTFHGLRHLHAARLADLVDLRTVALSTGHAANGTMAAHYANHAQEAHFQALRTAVEEAFPEPAKTGLEAFQGAADE